MFTRVYLSLHKFTGVYSCLSVCLPVFTYVNLYLALRVLNFAHVHSFLPVNICLRVFTPVSSCLPMFNYDYSCLPMFALVDSCLPMFTIVYVCLPLLTRV